MKYRLNEFDYDIYQLIASSKEGMRFRARIQEKQLRHVQEN